MLPLLPAQHQLLEQPGAHWDHPAPLLLQHRLLVQVHVRLLLLLVVALGPPRVVTAALLLCAHLQAVVQQTLLLLLLLPIFDHGQLLLQPVMMQLVEREQLPVQVQVLLLLLLLLLLPTFDHCQLLL